MDETSSAPDAAPTAAGRLSLADRVYGFVGAAAVLLALFFLVRGGPEDTGQPAPAVPRLTLLAPAINAAIAQPVTVEFDAGVEVTGSGEDRAAGRHVHVRAGASELMPGPSDIQPVGGTRYRWTLPRLPAGTHTLYLYWADGAHRPMVEGESGRVVVRVE